MTSTDPLFDERTEWLETDGLGGFASGTVTGVRTRRYHAWLLAAAGAPTHRFVLVNGCEAWADTPAGRFALTSQRYAPGVIHPDGAARIESFTHEPWPTWVFRLPGNVRIVHELFVRRGLPLAVASWRLLSGGPHVTITARPLISGRDPHALHHENPAFRFDPEVRGAARIWRPYDGVPGIRVGANGEYRPAPDWYRSFLYQVERERGLDDTEDLASPGSFHWDLARAEAIWVLAADTPETDAAIGDLTPVALARRLRAAERRRRAERTGLDRAADDYIVRRGSGLTVIAGYPWFGDWGRDTFIALRGLCLATGRLDQARRILLEWAGTVSEGMLPNRFADQGDALEFNSVDASLWFVIAVHELIAAAMAAGKPLAARDRDRLLAAVDEILAGYTRGTRYGIRLDSDGLLAAGASGVQLTWMDAKLGDHVVTPRIGKPVEVQALWLNALRLTAPRSELHGRILELGRESFRRKFWNADRGGLFDVVDVDHTPGVVDASMRPNQIFAVGGLPHMLLDGPQARAVVDTVERLLWTPAGPRSLAPADPAYVPRYRGGVTERDGAYHQGTVWPWLAGPFIEAWVRVRGGGRGAKQVARTRFFTPMMNHFGRAGLGHIPEIADGDPPHVPNGCLFQAWSVGEALRVDRAVLAESAERSGPQPMGGSEVVTAGSRSTSSSPSRRAGSPRERAATNRLGCTGPGAHEDAHASDPHSSGDSKEQS